MENKLIIVIPTRNRADTLYFTIKTCLEQEYTNYLIIVSDNDSKDNTCQVVESLNSDKIKYVNTHEPLSMTNHWNFALSHALLLDGYITFLGDDDGILPNSLAKINDIINAHKTKAVTWRKIEYCWPTHIHKPYRNMMILPFGSGSQKIYAKSKLAKAISFEVGYNDLPCVYNSFIHLSIIRSGYVDGRYFDTASPDVYSGFCNALLIDRYVYSNEPFTINGASGHSNGTAQRFRKINRNLGQEFLDLNRKDESLFTYFKHPQGVVSGCTMEAVLAIKGKFPERLSYLEINWSYFLKAAVREYKAIDYSEDEYDELHEIACREGLLDILEELKRTAPERSVVGKIRTSFDSSRLIVNSRFFLVNNVYSAAKVASALLKFSRGAAFWLRPLLNFIRKIRVKLKGIKSYLKFRSDFQEIKARGGARFSVNWKNRLPCLEDATANTGFDRHYVYHTAWAARKVYEVGPLQHVDISSYLYFATIVSAFVPVKFYDFRPAEVYLDGLSTKHADITNLPFPDNSILSLSCMHVVEHIGLGRYGEPLDDNGDLKAISELKRVVAKGGALFFVVPVGEPKIIFNAHRIYSYSLVLEYFAEFDLVEFCLIENDTSEGLIVNASESEANAQDYGCGCFWFKKR
ncbi:glycosyltransferase [Alcaligenaceae bacterium]|nr:glycosyltransferase [Alcaligenaceae bacterium]